MSKTIIETVEELHHSLSDYIEATYHIGDSTLVAQRKALLNELGVIHQQPFLESTPKYVAGKLFSTIEGIPNSSLALYEALSTDLPDNPKVIYNPPYKHQWQSVKSSLVEQKNLVIMTGTGSGKTESFLLPILGKLAKESSDKPNSFANHAVRSLILYPMNALVNDQLGRLRKIFGDDRTKTCFSNWSGRLPTFARYTSRTPYAGVREAKKDQIKLKTYEDFYVAIENGFNSDDTTIKNQANTIYNQLSSKGKWPAKPSVSKWYGNKKERWANSNDEFVRCVTLPGDSELLTRHEVQSNPPDLLITNYSMLEYMLMRPIERTIFEKTSSWLEQNPSEKFLIVIDEAHLYRGAAGAEVGLLLRRLRERLGISPDRFQVICSTASFEDKEYALEFASKLSGTPLELFVPVSGELDKKEIKEVVTTEDARILSKISLDDFYVGEESHQREIVAEFLEHRNATFQKDIGFTLFKALKDYSPLATLVNFTMGKAKMLSDLDKAIFPLNSQSEAQNAITVLLGLGSVAKEKPNDSGLLPCRMHNFFRGLPGLWICMDPNCNQLPDSQRGNTSGKLFSQPRERCDCGARVFELFTCRNCGSIHARAYTDNLEYPSSLWSNQGQDIRLFSSKLTTLFALDMLLEKPVKEDKTELAYLDFITGRINPENSPDETRRRIYMPKDRSNSQPVEDEDGDESSGESPGQFVICAVCGRSGGQKPAVQDHQTKGNQPFLSILSRQIQIQPPNGSTVTDFAPLAGRKVLIFSDSRQTAARLAPDLQMYSLRDAVRPLLVWGFKKLTSNKSISEELNLNDSYLALMIAANFFQIRFRPELSGAETFYEHDKQIRSEISKGALNDDAKFFKFFIRFRDVRAPESLLKEIVNTISDKFLGLDALALASISTKVELSADINALPDIGTIASDLVSKVALVNHWIISWQSSGFWFKDMPASWWKPSVVKAKNGVKGHKTGKFQAFDRVLDSKENKKSFIEHWLPKLIELFCETPDGVNRILAKNLTLSFTNNWTRCHTCSAVYKALPTVSKCIVCQCETTYILEPATDPVFTARKGYYRKGVLEILSEPPILPMALIAAEHTAQLNAAQTEVVFSKAEENELLFQDLNVEWPIGKKGNRAIDILSSTTTMEVGIDIGALSGVALRNMPPGRSNYQQRAGRAGRRGNAVATVVAFGSADSHDEHYFTNPEEMISGPVVDPIITLDNVDITKRHIRAFLLQKYLQERIPADSENLPSNLFSVLGKVKNFYDVSSILNREDFIGWLNSNGELLKAKVLTWIPVELAPKNRIDIVNGMISDCISAVDDAIDYAQDKTNPAENETPELPDQEIEIETEEDLGKANLDDNLLDRLLYRGKLPRYAFPTDVATFYVFDPESTPFRPKMKFAPSQGLPIALSQYAPDKQIWIANKCYTSSAIYSPIKGEREEAWKKKRQYYECLKCGFAKTTDYDVNNKALVSDCQACGEPLEKPSNWFRPPGFAHPFNKPEETSPDNNLDISYATRAKLYMPFPDDESWIKISDNIKGLKVRTHLLVSNTGPSGDGYDYCVSCGRIEATANSSGMLKGHHSKPFPDHDPDCAGFVSKIVLGTDFITDIGLFCIHLGDSVKLLPGNYSTDVALRTLCEALAIAATALLEIEANDIMAEYRPALNSNGKTGEEFEIFLYDILPGGAGFSTQLIDRSEELFKKALEIMSGCVEECDSSCYRCLRSFKNRFEHGLLDRHVGIELTNYILSGKVPEFSAERIAKATNILYDDLYRNLPDKYSVKKGLNDDDGNRDGMLTVTSQSGEKTGIAICAPLTPKTPANPAARAIYSGKTKSDLAIIPIDEFLILKHLPSATKIVLERLG